MWQAVIGKYLSSKLTNFQAKAGKIGLAFRTQTRGAGFQINVIQRDKYLFISQTSFSLFNFSRARFDEKLLNPRRMIERTQENGYININCVDPLGRSALLMAIDNENLEMVELLINNKVDTKDALLHAISEEFVEAVEVLLDHEDSTHHGDGPHVSIIFSSVTRKTRRESFKYRLLKFSSRLS